MKNILPILIISLLFTGCMKQGTLKESGDQYSGVNTKQIEARMDNSTFGAMSGVYLLVSPTQLTSKDGVDLGFAVEQSFKNDQYTSAEMNKATGNDVGVIQKLICLANGESIEMKASARRTDYSDVKGDGFGNYGYAQVNKAFIDATTEDFKKMASANSIDCKLYGLDGSAEYKVNGGGIGSGTSKINPKFHQAVKDFYSQVLIEQ